jgi:hypothetical protein
VIKMLSKQYEISGSHSSEDVDVEGGYLPGCFTI